MSPTKKSAVLGVIVLACAAGVLATRRPTAAAQTAGAAVPRAVAALLADDQTAKADALPVHDISLDQANVALQAAVVKSKAMHVLMDIAVVDAGGNLKAFARMDDAWLGSIDIAIKKAKTARYFNMETGAIGKLSQPGQPLYMIEVSNGGLITFPGGVPIKTSDGHVIGAIGVSGSSVEDDAQVATAGAQAVARPSGR